MFLGLYPRARLWHHPSMRSAPLLILLMLGGGVCAHAQEQERKLIDRILKPDTELENKSFDSTFYGGEKFEQGTESAVVKSYNYENRVNAKGFQTRDFAASPYWAGDFKFDTRKANDGRRAREESGQYSTRDFAVQAARDAGKDAETRTYGEAGKDFRGKEADRMTRVIEPGKEPAGWKGDLKPMTLDDIRDLLNKK